MLHSPLSAQTSTSHCFLQHPHPSTSMFSTFLFVSLNITSFHFHMLPEFPKSSQKWFISTLTFFPLPFIGSYAHTQVYFTVPNLPITHTISELCYPCPSTSAHTLEEDICANPSFPLIFFHFYPNHSPFSKPSHSPLIPAPTLSSGFHSYPTHPAFSL